MEKEIISALEKKKRAIDAIDEPISFNRIMLQFSKIKRIMSSLERIFNSLKQPGEKDLGVDELMRLMVSLNVRLDKDECENIFKIADVERTGDEKNRLDMQEFLVAIAVGYMLELIPALRDEEGEFTRDASFRGREASQTTRKLEAAEALEVTSDEDDDVASLSRRKRGEGERKSPPESSVKPLDVTLHKVNQQMGSEVSEQSKTDPSKTDPSKTDPSKGDQDEVSGETKGIDARRSSKDDILLAWRSKRSALRQSEMDVRPSMDLEHDETQVSGISSRGSVVSLFEEGHVFNGDDIRHCMHLIICAYLLFDADCRGFILKSDISHVFRGGDKREGAPTFLSENRWDEMDSDGDGRIMFAEFVHSFARWMDFGADEESMVLEHEGGPAEAKS